MNNEIRNTKYELRFGFTLVELVVAIGIMALVILFAGTVFKSSINSYRIASAQTEIMQKLRAITDQLNSDFKGLQKDGYLILYSTTVNRAQYAGAVPNSFRSDRLYFFSTGDFQSWYDPTVRSNIACIYLGHEGHSIFDSTIYVNHWRLAHDILLLSPGVVWPDVNSVSYAQCRANPIMVLNNVNSMLISPPNIDVTADPNTIRRLFCENAGEFKIEWADGTPDANSAIAWFGLGNPRGNSNIEPPVSGFYEALWTPKSLADGVEIYLHALRFERRVQGWPNIYPYRLSG